jgi:hypothetical protein
MEKYRPNTGEESVDRRQFLKSAVTATAGGALILGSFEGIKDSIEALSKVEELRDKAKQEVMVKISPPDEEALQTAQKIEEFRYAKGLINMSLDEINQYTQALKILDQQEEFERAVQKRVKQKNDERARSFVRTYAAGTAAMFGGACILARGVGKWVMGRNRDEVQPRS